MGLAAETVRHFGRQRREAVGEMEGGGDAEAVADEDGEFSIGEKGSRGDKLGSEEGGGATEGAGGLSC